MKLWREDKSATIERFRVSACRLCEKLESVGYFVELKRVDRTKYRLLLPDN